MANRAIIDPDKLNAAMAASANAIRAKTGASSSIRWDVNRGFADAISSIANGGGPSTPASIHFETLRADHGYFVDYLGDFLNLGQSFVKSSDTIYTKSDLIGKTMRLKVNGQTDIEGSIDGSMLLDYTPYETYSISEFAMVVSERDAGIDLGGGMIFPSAGTYVLYGIDTSGVFSVEIDIDGDITPVMNERCDISFTCTSSSAQLSGGCSLVLDGVRCPFCITSINSGLNGVSNISTYRGGLLLIMGGTVTTTGDIKAYRIANTSTYAVLVLGDGTIRVA